MNQRTRLNFGKTLKLFRSELGLTQEELAWRAGLHRSYVADVERGARNLSLSSIEKLAEALEISITALFARSEAAAPEVNNQLPAGVRGRPVDILLVEDEPNDVELTLWAFKRARMNNRIHVARDGVEALEFLSRHTGDHRAGGGPPNLVVLLDLGLPRVDGVSVLRAMKENERTRPIPVIVLTMSQETRDMEECRRLGVESYLAKPVDFHTFSQVTPRLSLRWSLLSPAAKAAA